MTQDAHMRERHLEKKKAAAYLRDSIQTIASEGRDADTWENECLAFGISALFRGQYSTAQLESDMALVPPNDRSEQWRPQKNLHLEHLDLVSLCAALKEIEQRPPTAFPHFGKIVFVRD